MRMITAAIAAVMTVGALVPAVHAQQDKSIYELGGAEAKYKPGGFKPAPGTIETRFGKLEFPGGYPTEETVQRVHDELDLQRATQLYLDMYPTLSLTGMMIGTVRDWEAKSCSHISVTANRLDSKSLFLTGNTESIYAMSVFDL